MSSSKFEVLKFRVKSSKIHVLESKTFVFDIDISSSQTRDLKQETCKLETNVFDIDISPLRSKSVNSLRISLVKKIFTTL